MNLASQLASAPWLTVVIPSFCGERWIDACLCSLAAENVEGVEVILIDGSPSPLSRDIAHSYAGRLRLRVFERSDLLSWQAKTNFGVHLAESSHVSWLGVDDMWLPGRAAAVRRWIEESPKAVLHIAPSIFIDKKGRKIGLWRCPLPANRDLPAHLVSERLLVQNFIAAPAPVFRKEAWLGCGGLDETLWYTADWDMWLKLAGLGPVLYHDAVTAGFRIHGTSLTLTGSREPAVFKRQMQIVLDRHLSKLGCGSKELERTARASITVNAALASASAGHWYPMLSAVVEVLRLGPSGLFRYMRDSRIFERAGARVRAKLTGAF